MTLMARLDRHSLLTRDDGGADETAARRTITSRCMAVARPVQLRTEIGAATTTQCDIPRGEAIAESLKWRRALCRGGGRVGLGWDGAPDDRRARVASRPSKFANQTGAVL